MALPNLGVNADLNGAVAFSADSQWNMRVDTAPVAANSAQIIAAIGPSSGIHPEFGTGDNGIPYVVVDENQPLVPFDLNLYPDEGDPGPYPIPANAPIEGGIDDHVIVVQRDPSSPNGLGNLYELYQAEPTGSGWSGYGAVFDLSEGDFQRPTGWTSADAAGLPIFPGLVRYDEVEQAIAEDGVNGVIPHALRFTLSGAFTDDAFVGNATHYAGAGIGVAPMGMRVRLRADFEIDPNLSPETQVILNTLKSYGMILADNGGNWFVTGAPDERWNDEELHSLLTVTGANFEVVDTSNLQPSPTPTPTPTPEPAPNAAPVGSADTYTLSAGSVLAIAGPGLLANDTDADGDVLSAGLGTGPSHGVLSLNPNGAFEYTPEAGYEGADSFTYQVSDGEAASAPVPVSVTIAAAPPPPPPPPVPPTEPNEPPVAQADSYVVARGGRLEVSGPGILANDTDADGDALTARVDAGPLHGTVTVDPSGGFTYAPDAGYRGRDSFTYVASDGESESSGTVSIRVEGAAPTPEIPFEAHWQGYEIDGTFRGTDVVAFVHNLEADLGGALEGAADVGGGTVISDNAGNSLTLAGVDVSTLQSIGPLKVESWKVSAASGAEFYFS